MAKLLITGPGTSNYRLPLDTDLEGLRADIETAFDRGESLAVDVEMGDDPTNNAMVILNGKAAPFVVLAEIQADPGPEPVPDLAG